ncbi:MAG: hypothetical protein ACM34I_08570 [bacterium]
MIVLDSSVILKWVFNKGEAAETIALFWGFDFEVFHFQEEDYLSIMGLASSCE